ncbi:PfkB family carbohydrate kinase [Schaalia vaccimaxillae]|uniref:PfkB family carbohydrate kinase n=1 Tax=Schaalia vaccimaxillae TaxID=183916 RepID=UPI0003B773CB|nr:PfkB family carbohydrate kinase [Schaalia vaccimaxillae]
MTIVPSQLSIRDRALGALTGLAVGDALGMPTQAMSPEWIRTHYGAITGLTSASPDQPYAPNMPAGSVTDDTEQALLVADLLVAGGGRIDPNQFAQTLLAWEDDMIRRGSLDLLGPSTKAALEAVRAGADPTTTGTTGATNGAAMRVTPIGIASPTTTTDLFFTRVWDSCQVTHATRQGFQSAALVAAAVSLGVDGCSVAQALSGAVELVSKRGDEGAWNEHADVLARTRTALELAQAPSDSQPFIEMIRAHIGTSVEATESIPAAFALARKYADDPMQAVLAAANLGGDTDTIGAITGAILGACLGPAAFADVDVALIESTSGIDLRSTAEALVNLRLESAPRKGRVVQLGQVIVDLALRTDAIPEPGGDVFADDAGMHAGGGFNALYAARQMDIAAISLSGIGEGGFASIVDRALADIGVEALGPRVPGMDTGYCVALTDASSERTFISTRGAECFVPADAWADFARNGLHPGDVIHVDGYALAHVDNAHALRAFVDAAPHDLRVLVDVSPMVGEVNLEDLLALKALHPLWSMNERESQILADRLCDEACLNTESVPVGPAQAAHWLSRALTSPVLVRCGADGAWYCDAASGEPTHIPTPLITPVDTNGAGDAHSGVLAACMVEDMPIERALLLANCAGALAATRVGPATCPSRDEVAAAAARLNSGTEEKRMS